MNQRGKEEEVLLSVSQNTIVFFFMTASAHTHNHSFFPLTSLLVISCASWIPSPALQAQATSYFAPQLASRKLRQFYTKLLLDDAFFLHFEFARIHYPNSSSFQTKIQHQAVTNVCVTVQ